MKPRYRRGTMPWYKRSPWLVILLGVLLALGLAPVPATYWSWING